ncbi:MAG: LPXTG cell wall anchor domain-containing protein [Aerococcus suis]|nr:LPXTG cell wall anchor domain-containing protein [Aerococcus suis]
MITTDNMQIIIPDMTIDHNKPLEEANIEKLSVPQEQASHSDYLVNNDNASNQTAERLPETGQQTNWWYSLVALITGIRLFNYKKRRQGD